MSVQTQTAKGAYRIDNDWLNAKDGANGTYVDLQEIAQGISTYVTEIGGTVADEQRRANFIPTGIMLGNTSSGSSVCVLLHGMAPGDEVEINGLAEGVIHPMSVRRIYVLSNGSLKTEARDIVIFGYGQSNIA